MNEWIDETCDTCQFNIDGRCRKNPPSHQGKDHNELAFSFYPFVTASTPACSCWRLRSYSAEYKSEIQQDDMVGLEEVTEGPPDTTRYISRATKGCPACHYEGCWRCNPRE